MAVPNIAVTISHASCTNVAVVSSAMSLQTLTCTVSTNEAGYHFVDLTNEQGQAAVSPSSLVPGPHRNGSSPHGSDSPYPQFLLVPVISSIVPDRGSTQGGTAVTIVGSGFSPVAGRMTVLLGDIECVIHSSTYSEILCVTSEGGEGEGDVRVTVNGFEAETTTTYEYTSSATPTISSISPETGVIGASIEIYGTNFGTEPSSVSVLILNRIEEWEYGSTEFSCVISLMDDSYIMCSLPARAAGIYQVVVHVEELGLAADIPSIDYPLTITSLSPSQCGNGGGVEITISGSGFPEITESDTSLSSENGENLVSVWFCSTQCHMRSSQLNEMKCVLDAPSDEDISSICSDIRVTYNDMLAIATENFEFSDDLTPHVSSISPLIGGTAGGTIVTILGSKLLPPGVTEPNEDDVIVTIDSAVCVWYGVGYIPTDTSIECRTSDHRTTLLAEVKVFVQNRGFAIPETPETQVWFQYIDRWSSPYTWGEDGVLPKEGDSVLIQKGQIVFLDTDTPVLNLILIEGELVFEDLQDLHLQAKYIFINTGRLQVRLRKYENHQ